MAFFSPTAVKNTTEKSGAGAYLNPSKIADGATARFTILSTESTDGFELWFETPAGKSAPRRTPEEPDTTIIEELALEVGGPLLYREGKPQISFFTAFFCWNYDNSRVELCSITQKKLREDLMRYVTDPDWSDLSATDFKLLRTGKGIDTRYTLDPAISLRTKDKVMAKTISDAYATALKSGYDINALFTPNGNPFGTPTT